MQFIHFIIHTNRRILREVGNWNYQTKEKNTTNYRFSLFIDNSKISKYKNIDLTGIEADSCKTINDICKQVKEKQTFKYKNQDPALAFFDHWIAMIIFGIILFIYGKKM